MYIQWIPALNPRCIKKLRLHFLALLGKAAKKLRLCQTQAKKLVKKLRLSLLPDEFSFLEPQAGQKNNSTKIMEYVEYGGVICEVLK